LNVIIQTQRDIRLKRFIAELLAFTLVAGLVFADPDSAGQTSGKPGPGHEAAPVPPPSKDWSVTVGVDYYSEYIFRGVDVLKNNPLALPSIIAEYKNVTGYYFGYFGDGDDAKPGNDWYEENDFALDYTQPVLHEKLSLTVGAYGYTYPDGVSGNDTFDLYGRATWSSYLNPYTGINWDVDKLHTGYGIIGVTHTYDVSKHFNLKDGTLSVIPTAQLGIDFGYNSRRTRANTNWNDVLLGISVPYYITPQLCVHAGFQVSIALNSLHEIGQGNERIGNAGVSYSF
jgi:hypothetical protein